MYPEIPGVAGLALHSPLFAQVTLTLENGHTLTINGTNASRTTPYVQSVSLNGSDYGSPWLPLAALVNTTAANTLTFTLGSSVSTWGTTPTTNAPPSFPAPTTTAPDIAIGKTATADGTACNGSQTPQYAVDGNSGTKWCEGFTGAGWLKVDLGQVYPVTGFLIQHGGFGTDPASDNTRDYKIQWSSDGNDSGTWNDLVTVTGNTRSVTTYGIAPTNLRWVRLYITAGQQDGSPVARIPEFEVFSSAAAPPVAYGNTGMSDDSNPSAGNFDQGGNSYSAQALQALGILPGTTVTYNGVNFTWPAAAAGLSNNYIANGQTIAVTPVAGAATLGFLGAATHGPASGTATVTYTDHSTQTFTLAFNDWYYNSGGVFTVPGTATRNGTVATMAYRNTSSGAQVAPFSLFYMDIALSSGKTIQSVTLPITVTQGQLHVFALGTGMQSPLS